MSIQRRRERTRGGFVSRPRYFTQIVTNPPSSDSNTRYFADGTVERMTDYVSSNFTRRSKEGEIVNTPMEWTRTTRYIPDGQMIFTETHPTPGNVVNSYTGAINYRNGDPTSSYSIDYYMPLSLVDESLLIHQAALKARNGITPAKVQALVSLAELNKSISLIANTTQTLVRFAKAVLRGSPKAAIEAILGRKIRLAKAPKQVTSSAAQRWLEYRYGWLPMVYEVRGIADAMSSAQRVLPLRQTSRGFQKGNGNWVFTSQFDRGAEGLHDLEYTFDQQIEVRAYSVYEADLQFRSARDYGLFQLPASAWELVPFSFVADWFLSVGDWIEAIQPRVGVKILAEGYTVKRRDYGKNRVTAWTKQGVSNNFSFDMSGTMLDPSHFVSLEILSKKRNTSFDIPLATPRLRISLNRNRLVDALALLRVVSKSSLRI